MPLTVAYCRQLAHLLQTFSTSRYEHLTNQLLRLSLIALVFTIVFCLAVCLVPHGYIHWVLAALSIIPAIVPLVWYFVTSVRRHRLSLDNLRIHDHSDLENNIRICGQSHRIFPVFRPASGYIFKPKQSASTTMMTVTTVLLFCMPALVMCSYSCIASRDNDRFQDTHALRDQRLSFGVISLLRHVRVHLGSDECTHEECAICLDAVAGSTVSILSCNHKFHEECLRKWLGVNRQCTRCPLCKMIIHRIEPLHPI